MALPEVLFQVLVYNAGNEKEVYCVTTRVQIIDGKLVDYITGVMPNYQVEERPGGELLVRRNLLTFRVNGELQNTGKNLEGWFSSELNASAIVTRYIPRIISSGLFRRRF